MFKFVIFTICAFALIYQSAVEASAKDEAKKALASLLEAIDKVLTEAQSTLDSAVATVQDKATELEDKAVAELDKVLEPLKAKLDDYIAQAKANGFDVTKCQSYVDAFENTPDNLVKNLVECITKQLTDAQKYVDDALASAKAIEQDLSTIDAEIDDCGGNAISQAKCYAKIIAKIAEDTGSAPQKIVEDIAKTAALITNLLPNIEDCLVEQLKKAGEDAAEAVAEFAICAAL